MSNIGKLGAVLVVLVVGSLAAGASLSSATHVFVVQNESVTVDYNTNTTVANADVAVSFYDNETVRNASGAALTEGTDYEWDSANGTINWLNTAATTDGASATMSYAYDAPSQRSRDLSGVLTLVGQGLALLVLLMGGFVVLGWVGGGR